MKWLILLLALPVFMSCGACDNGLSRKTDTLYIATWNVQALFDEIEDGYEYKEYGAGWTREKYRARLNSIAHALDSLEETPDIFTLIEIEKSQILNDLINDYLKDYGYRWTFFGTNDGAPLGIGVVSRFPVTQTRVHSLSNQGMVIPRPVLEVEVMVEEKPLVLFLCHWKSKLGGDAETESLRRAAACIIARRVADIRREAADAPVIVLGDLNENHDEFYRQGNSFITALLPDDADAAAMALKSLKDMPYSDFLVVSAEKPPMARHFLENLTYTRAFAPAVFYSPWSAELSGGSYHYQGEWETLDHVLLNDPLFDNTGWEFDSCVVIDVEPFINGYGYPASYNPRTGDGLSDHLPLLLTLKLLP
ncbi:MAG: endonuclease/exonuclease/phosphatase family protein [Treponema sp.]|jgi:endonuclease/exonuclease/phosphatase family metal-dependent hydrolase|nr:endonuclease/exonuclease/phosphatase family protein [Treponema sp.]